MVFKAQHGMCGKNWQMWNSGETKLAEILKNLVSHEQTLDFIIIGLKVKTIDLFLLHLINVYVISVKFSNDWTIQAVRNILFLCNLADHHYVYRSLPLVLHLNQFISVTRVILGNYHFLDIVYYDPQHSTLLFTPTTFMLHSPIWKVNSYSGSQKFSAFKEHEGSVQCSQEHDTGFSQSTLHIQDPFLYQPPICAKVSDIITWEFNQFLYAVLVSTTYATCYIQLISSI